MITQRMMDEWIAEDVPYFDLTTHVLGIGGTQGSIGYFCRDRVTLALMAEAAEMLRRFGLSVEHAAPSGSVAEAGNTFLSASGSTEGIMGAWKAVMNLLEYACGIATRTARLVAAAHEGNPDVAVLTTRKVFPGTKAVSISAALAGGALPHRLGLGETILVFDSHLAKLGGYAGLAPLIPGIKRRVCDKEICVEVETEEDALLMAEAGADALQFDKVAPDTLAGIVKKIRGTGSRAKLIAAGGVNADNAGDYARTGIDAISTTWIYFGKPADMYVRIG